MPSKQVHVNESFHIRFVSGGKPLNVVDFDPEVGVTLDHHRDASPLTFAIGVQSLIPVQLAAVRQRHGWDSDEFHMHVAMDSGGLTFSGVAGDPGGLPPGAYDITFELESYRFRKAQQRIVIHKGERVEIVLDEQPDPRRVKLRNNIDPITSRVLQDARSKLDDGVALIDWLNSPFPRAPRKACLLNLLCKLRTPPGPAQGFTDPLTSLMNFVFAADVDRIYAAFETGLQALLEAFVKKGIWAKEGHPGAPIHQLLRRGMERIGVAGADDYELTSYRQGGTRCLQIVVATPPGGKGTCYADVDIDLGNPFWDAQGLIIHLSELLDPSKTDHLALHDKLDKGETQDFLYYDLVEAKSAEQ